MIKRKFTIPKYIKKLKNVQAPQLLIGKEGIGLNQVYHPAFDRNKVLPKELQLQEFYSKWKNTHNFMNENYKTLLTSLKQADEEYEISSKKQERINLSNKSLTLWRDFLQNENKELPASQTQIRDDVLKKLKDIWMRYKVINNSKCRKEINKLYIQKKFFLFLMSLQ
jgi:hypothetical protein